MTDLTITERIKKPRSKYRNKKRAEEREMWASYNLVKPPKPRYTGLQGILWHITSQLVRRADFEAYGGYCVDGCGGKVARWEDAHCGHYQTAGRSATRFMLENLALQLPACNQAQSNGDVSKSTGFAKEIDRRYGKGMAERIIEISKQTHKISDDWIKERIVETIQKLSTLQ